jgi:hypothetical protein
MVTRTKQMRWGSALHGFRRHVDAITSGTLTSPLDRVRHSMGAAPDLYWRHHAAREHKRLYPALDQRNDALAT